MLFDDLRGSIIGLEMVNGKGRKRGKHYENCGDSNPSPGTQRAYHCCQRGGWLLLFSFSMSQGSRKRKETLGGGGGNTAWLSSLAGRSKLTCVHTLCLVTVPTLPIAIPPPHSPHCYSSASHSGLLNLLHCCSYSVNYSSLPFSTSHSLPQSSLLFAGV